VVEASRGSAVSRPYSPAEGDTTTQVDYRITAPTGVRLDVRAKNASVVSIDGAPRNVAVTATAEGDVAVNLTRAARRLRASTLKGSIDIDVPHGAYAIAATAPNGDKTITGVTASPTAHRSIDASTADGDLTIRGR
jgi:Putative adhesin